MSAIARDESEPAVRLSTPKWTIGYRRLSHCKLASKPALVKGVFNSVASRFTIAAFHFIVFRYMSEMWRIMAQFAPVDGR
jgi:hypothetical protein